MSKFSYLKVSIFVLLVLNCSEVLDGHSGGLDSRGGHRNRSTGGYHYHRSSITSFSSVRQPAVRVNYRTVSPTTSRTQARTTPTRSETFNSKDLIKNQPPVSKSAASTIKPPVTRELRIWTSADGKFQVEARFKSNMLNHESKGLVSIETTEGEPLKVRSFDLSTLDRLYIRKIIGAKPGL